MLAAQPEAVPQLAGADFHTKCCHQVPVTSSEHYGQWVAKHRPLQVLQVFQWDKIHSEMLVTSAGIQC